MRQIKASPKATPALLELLRIAAVADSGAARADAAKPALTLRQGAAEVEISFRKLGRGGIRLYCRRGPETAFTEVGTFTTSPARDRRPNLLPAQAEIHAYYAWYVDRDEPVGEQGDTARLAVAAQPR